MDKKIILSIIICTLLILPVVANAEQNVIRPKIVYSILNSFIFDSDNRALFFHASFPYTPYFE